MNAPVQPQAGAMSRVPPTSVAFWVTVALTAGMGETASDFLFTNLNPPIVLAIGLVATVVTLVLQFRARRYVAWIYWLTFGVAAVSGTMPADVARVGMGVPTAATTIFFAIVLAAIIASWYRIEKTLAFDSISTRRREAFYWAAVLAMFTLGTSAADMTANTLHLGYLLSAVVFGAVIGIILVARLWFGLGGIAAFWLAYIATRPFSASVADWFAHTPGLGWGSGPVTLALMIAIIGFVGYQARMLTEATATARTLNR
jgi:uncharacterized membrane-anchored protein